VARFHLGCRAGVTKGDDMASISKNANGQRRIQFYDGNGKRRSLGIGSISERNAERIRDKVEQLVEHAVTGTPLNQEVSRWVAGLDDRMHSKLKKVGLVEDREPAQPEATLQQPEERSLEAFLVAYLVRRTDVKQGTLTFYSHTQRNLVSYFGAEKLLSEITEGDADDFRRYLIRELPSEATVNRRCGMAKTFFRAAVRHRLIPSNPFQDLDATPKSNASRQRFIARETIDKIMECAPDAEWRLIIALARYGGLRIPSEALSLKWSDVDFEKERIRVTAPKTEHHDGRGTREIPIFPELVGPLRDAFELADVGTEYVISRHRPASVVDKSGNWRHANLRTQFKKLICRAGFTPWPKLFQNLRSTRETELAEDHPLHVVCAWIGNTERIAAKHYLQVTDDHFRSASKPTTSETVRKLVRYGTESSRIDSQSENDDSHKSMPYKEKRPRAETRDRSSWAILDSNQ
jgi:integrase